MINIQGIRDTDPKGLDNIFWFIVDADQNAIVIDPGRADMVLQYIEDHGLRPDSILLTHNCHDHADGIPEITAKYHCPVLGPENEEIESITQAFTEGDEFERMGVKFQVLSLPGHTADHIGFIANGKHFFCGDVIFGAGCGRVSSSGGEQAYKEMHASLQKCAGLPPATKLYWGHEYTVGNLLFASKAEPGNKNLLKRVTSAQEELERQGFCAPGTIKEELATNPFLRTAEDEVIAKASEHAGKKLSSAAAVFTALRKWKNEG